MKKFLFLIGGAIGFLVGSRLGRGPYEAVEQKVRSLTQHPELQSDTEESDSLTSNTATATSTSPVTDSAPSPADTVG